MPRKAKPAGAQERQQLGVGRIVCLIVCRIVCGAVGGGITTVERHRPARERRNPERGPATDLMFEP